MQTRQTLITPHEFLARWDDSGNFQGAHVVFLGKVLDDNGSVIAAQTLPPQSIAIGEQQGFPLAAILEPLQIDALKQVDSLNRQIEILNQTLSQMAENHQQHIDQLRSL